MEDFECHVLNITQYLHFSSSFVNIILLTFLFITLLQPLSFSFPASGGSTISVEDCLTQCGFHIVTKDQPGQLKLFAA